MHAVVVYESMYGNTHLIAEAIGDGLGARYEAVVLPVSKAMTEPLDEAGLLVVGGPTHAWTVSRPNTRRAAVMAANKPGSGLHLEPEAEGLGLRDWFGSLNRVPGHAAAAFDTRFRSMFSGGAARGIARQLHRAGYDLAAKPEGFLVTKANTLVEGERMRARAWGEQLAALVPVS